MRPILFIGWDVGGWHCDRNRHSRDALVVLDETGRLVGEPWRGNLSAALSAADSDELLSSLAERCHAAFDRAARCLMAVDATLGFPQAFVSLLSGEIRACDLPERSDQHPLLFRRTDRFLAQRGFRPLSPVKDMIGAQATKAICLRRRFAPRVVETGVWSDASGRLRIIEAYPATLKRVDGFELPFSLRSAHADVQDAWRCARLAWLFYHDREALCSPPKDVSDEEGWIWVPGQALSC